jgi:solute carrier family 25 phosphate transporter 3
MIPSYADRQYANGLVSGFTKILSTEGIGSLYAGFIPILAKQVPYAIGQFTVNERCTEAIYNQMTPETKANLGPVQNLGITLGSGVVAGFAAAILSHVNFVFLPFFSYIMLIKTACRYITIADQQGTWS